MTPHSQATHRYACGCVHASALPCTSMHDHAPSFEFERQYQTHRHRPVCCLPTQPIARLHRTNVTHYTHTDCVQCCARFRTTAHNHTRPPQIYASNAYRLLRVHARARSRTTPTNADGTQVEVWEGIMSCPSAHDSARHRTTPHTHSRQRQHAVRGMGRYYVITTRSSARAEPLNQSESVGRKG
jgi:hypothetical protein